MKKGKFLTLGMLAMVLTLGLVVFGCATGGGGNETDTLFFPENMLGEWNKDSGSLVVNFHKAVPEDGIEDYRLGVTSVSGAFILQEISGNSYTLSSTHPDGGRWSMNLNFTARIGADGKLTISGAKEVSFGTNTVSSWNGSSGSVNDLNGTYTKK